MTVTKKCQQRFAIFLCSVAVKLWLLCSSKHFSVVRRAGFDITVMHPHSTIVQSCDIIHGLLTHSAVVVADKIANKGKASFT